jgi:predicted nucleic acid-binding Zn ribbon protein
MAVALKVNTIYEMRQAGASLQQIAEATHKSKERIRQLLVKSCGTTKFGMMSTAQLCNLLGLSRNQIAHLYKEHIILPEVEWNTGKHHRLFWSPEAIERIASYYRRRRLCKICSRPIPKGRWVYCSQECYQEGQKYIYKDAEAKERRLRSIRKSIQKRKLLDIAQTIAKKWRESDLVLVK